MSVKENLNQRLKKTLFLDNKDAMIASRLGHQHNNHRHRATHHRYGEAKAEHPRIRGKVVMLLHVV